jgi:hypothetical protein
MKRVVDAVVKPLIEACNRFGGRAIQVVRL